MDSGRGNVIKITPIVGALTLLSCLTTGTSYAQSSSGGNVFAGYAHVNADVVAGSRTNLNGWNLSVEKKILPYFGVVADFSGFRGSQILPASVICPGSGSSTGNCTAVSGNVGEELFLFGLRGSATLGRLRPFAQAMVGATHVSENGAGFSTSDAEFSDTLGGGFDFRLISRFSWRVQADYVRTAPNFSDIHHSVRLSTGAVIRF